MNLTRAETLCLTLIPLPFSEYMRHPDRLEYETLGHEQREWAFRSLQQRGFVTFTEAGSWCLTVAGLRWTAPNKVRVLTRRAK
jgi:hypothetical protein